MAHRHDSQLDRFGLEPETLQLTKSLLHTARLRTGPGSGHELGQGVVGLPAICAYIACKRLNSTEVDLKSAQTASCVRSLVFKKTLETVELVLQESPKYSTDKIMLSSPQKVHPTPYKALLDNHKFRRNIEVLLTWLMEAEKALLESGELRPSEIKKLKGGQLLTCAVFGWTCAVFKSPNVTHDLLKQQYKLAEDSYDDLIRCMDSACSLLADKIHEQQASMRKKGKGDSSSGLLSSPSKSRPTSPTKSAMKRNSSFTPVDQPTPSKRKVIFMQDEENADTEVPNVMETPSKKRKLTYSTPGKGTLSTPGASSSRVTLDAVVEVEEPMAVDSPRTQPATIVISEPPLTPRRSTRVTSSPTKISPTKRTPTTKPKLKDVYSKFIEDEDGNGLQQQMRVRPVFLDHRQWFIRDPRIQREVKRGNELSRGMLDNYRESMIEKYRPVAAVT